MSAKNKCQEKRGTIPGEKCMALRADTEHGPMLYSGNEYVTAWFMYWLQRDEYTGRAFGGENAEILSNTKWQYVWKNFHKCPFRPKNMNLPN